MRPRTEGAERPAMAREVSAAGKTLAERLAALQQAWRRIIGAPDYQAYLARHRQIHPDVPPMSEKEFFRFAIDRRYSKAGPRCC